MFPLRIGTNHGVQMTVADLIDGLGGLSKVTRALKARGHSLAGPSTVGEWKRSSRIPLQYWDAMIEMASEVGITLDAQKLLAMHVKAA